MKIYSNQKRVLEENISNLLSEYSFKFNETSYLGLRPGDLVQFTYDGVRRCGLVVSSKRTSSGHFISTLGNYLINIMIVTDGLSTPRFSYLVDRLYRKPAMCSYNRLSLVRALLGKDNFRTYKIGKITDILDFQINTRQTR